ncbi:MAG: hypothetical protein ACK5MR_11210 [Cumulibacter sp.]
MTDAQQVEFAPEWDRPVDYIERTRDWYLALGYANPYRWAHFTDSPFAPLTTPLHRSRVALVTTAAPYQPDKGDQGPGAPYNAAAKFYRVYEGSTDTDPDLRISHVAIDRAHTSTTDMQAWFPIHAARRAAAAGRIGELAPRFYGLPTNRSQRHTLTVDGPEVVARCHDAGIDAVVLIANCPVCHQSCSLTARALEASGISTVLMGAAKDIVEYCGVPRFVFSDVPLGNAAGIPHDTPSQDATFELALQVLESAPAARTTVTNPLRWPGPREWRLDYNNAERLDADERARLRAENDDIKRVARSVRDA